MEPSNTPENQTDPTQPSHLPLQPGEQTAVLGSLDTRVTPSQTPRRRPWAAVIARSRKAGFLAATFVVLVILGGAAYYVIHTSRQSSSKATFGNANLSDKQLEQLASGSLQSSSSSQTLNFNTGVVINKGLQVNGATSLANLSVSGVLTPNNLEIKQNAQVDGATLLQGAVTTKGQLNVGGNLAVTGTSIFSGNANFSGNGAFGGTLSASSISAKSATIGGLSFGHIVTTGSTPTATPNNGAGGGSVTISGNDTSGTVTITTGASTPSRGDLVTITFRTPFTSTPHPIATPLGIDTATNIAASGGEFYVSGSTTQMVIGVSKLSLGVAGVTYTFNYLVTQ